VNNILKNFDTLFASEETIKIAKDNAFALQQLMAMTEQTISKRNAELAEAFKAEINRTSSEN
jgi:uncharacterized protein YajQ (UPF0234 family)